LPWKKIISKKKRTLTKEVKKKNPSKRRSERKGVRGFGVLGKGKGTVTAWMRNQEVYRETRSGGVNATGSYSAVIIRVC